jgi:hypothetical protein
MGVAGAAFTAVEAVVFTPRVEGASAAAGPRRLGWAQASRAPRQARQWARLVARLRDPAAAQIEASAAR